MQSEDRLASLLPQVVTLARKAGDAILRVYSEVDPAIEYKRDNSPLTQADMASHHVIVEGLTRLTPEWPVLSEESKEIPFDQRSQWTCFWLVDPLDGTKEFLRRNGEFTVNIALMGRNSPVLGVVYAPAMDVMYYAAKGAGAWKSDGKASSPVPIRTAQSANDHLRVVVSRSHGSGEENLDRFTGGAQRCEFVPMGSSLKFCLVAEGVADLYPRTGPTMEWDTAAAQCIVEQAGGQVTDLDGNPMQYNKPVLLNPGFVARAER
ncbi:MAG: 3'(2'),5'-bisphosphate nucleotidase CysQ [Acidobacteriaceae bacterium]